MPSKKKSLKRKKRAEEKESRWSKVSHTVKTSVVGVLLIGAALILILAIFSQAGPVGQFLYNFLFALLGWGYYLLPFLAILIAAIFFITHEEKSFSLTFLGAAILILASIGLIDVLFPEKAGYLGAIIGFVEKPFGKIAGLVVVSVLIVGSLLVTLNVPLKLTRKIKDDLNIKDAFGDTVKTSVETDNSKTNLKVTEAIGKEDPDKFRGDKAVKIKNSNYKAPPLSLLKTTTERPLAGDLRANANIIKRTLESFGIPVEMGEINIGPKVTRYTLKPAEGVKLTKITALNQDLALALAAHPLRIEAPIPGKSLVGIEIPNKTAAIVNLGSLLNYSEFTKGGPLSFILGRDVNGEPILANIEKMPHCLVSGSTGSGKSILIHSIITSLLYKNSPETLRMVMIDPKRVELSVYNGIPHLVSPVVIEGKKAVNVFRWAVQEMEDRYETLLAAGARDIGSYNSNTKEEHMPYLLMVVDELADLMAAHGREIETAIVRLAQMSRATGIHLILSTQRPSVEVITGLIKANVTTRVALQVASQIDSRTILDMAGAEKLLGGGDMLFLSSDYSRPKRIQGPYITEKEIQAVAKYIKENNQPLNEEESADENINQAKEVSFDEFQAGAEDADDELFSEAVQLVRSAKKASASLLQRRLKVGYARAARLLDIMEEKGMIGPSEGAKAREVYIESTTVEESDSDIV